MSQGGFCYAPHSDMLKGSRALHAYPLLRFNPSGRNLLPRPIRKGGARGVSHPSRRQRSTEECREIPSRAASLRSHKRTCGRSARLHSRGVLPKGPTPNGQGNPTCRSLVGNRNLGVHELRALGIGAGASKPEERQTTARPCMRTD